jgi:hypothetical protein
MKDETDTTTELEAVIADFAAMDRLRDRIRLFLDIKAEMTNTPMIPLWNYEEWSDTVSISWQEGWLEDDTITLTAEDLADPCAGVTALLERDRRDTEFRARLKEARELDELRWLLAKYGPQDLRSDFCPFQHMVRQSLEQETRDG